MIILMLSVAFVFVTAVDANSPPYILAPFPASSHRVFVFSDITMAHICTNKIPPYARIIYLLLIAKAVTLASPSKYLEFAVENIGDELLLVGDDDDDVESSDYATQSGNRKLSQSKIC